MSSKEQRPHHRGWRVDIHDIAAKLAPVHAVVSRFVRGVQSHVSEWPRRYVTERVALHE